MAIEDKKIEEPKEPKEIKNTGKTPEPETEGEDKIKGKLPKFNIYWIYLLIVLVLIGANFMQFNPDLSQISELEVKEYMLAKGYVDTCSTVG